MAVFKFETRGNLSPQGKQKIYFCAHPDDYDKFLSAITSEILNILEMEDNQNCSFFYLEDAKCERDDDFFLKLKEMTLLVMPITANLLTTENPAIDLEFPFAIKNHIPILPLMMERGLNNAFNQKCKNLQFLDPNARDDTALSYKEKLTKFLTSILIGNELSEKIRKAFDAYIFLSYRKKDRVYAQELMRLIHKNDFCRDIAIWYDEFLTPGEDFNDSIKDALDKSKIFAIAVTPNLVNEDNYIMSVEYPMAKKANKAMLPAELVPTDKLELAKKYPDIPSCIDAHQDNLLSAALFDALHDIAVRENDSDPEHNFFIGLAYLSGIDVEKDKDRAVALITSAAEAGLPEAIEKLIYMYRKGEGVEINYKEPVKWQKKLVPIKENEYLKHKNNENALNYLRALCNLGDYLYEDRLLDDAEKAYNIFLSKCIDIYENTKQHWVKRYISISYRKLGDLRDFCDDPRGAEKYYLKSIEMRKELVSQVGSLQAFDDLVIILSKYAFINYDKHEECFRKILEICTDLADSHPEITKYSEWRDEALFQLAIRYS